MLVRPPRGPLGLFVKQLWASGGADLADGPRARREHVLPTGSTNLVLRLDDEPVRVWGDGGAPLELGTAVVGGVRSTYYVKDARPVRSVGAQLHAAASLPLLGVAADELAGCHTRLEEVWGAEASLLRARLQEARSPAEALQRFEAALEQRLPLARAVHPAVALALARFGELAEVAEVVAETGWSHRRFLTVFREAVGLSPKRYCRVLRFQRAIAGVSAGQPLGAVALDAGYSDQAHLTREFREIAGVSPGAYRAMAPEQDHHVPIDGSSDSFKTARRGAARVRS